MRGNVSKMARTTYIVLTNLMMALVIIISYFCEVNCEDLNIAIYDSMGRMPAIRGIVNRAVHSEEKIPKTSNTGIRTQSCTFAMQRSTDCAVIVANDAYRNTYIQLIILDEIRNHHFYLLFSPGTILSTRVKEHCVQPEQR